MGKPKQSVASLLKKFADRHRLLCEQTESNDGLRQVSVYSDSDDKRFRYAFATWWSTEGVGQLTYDESLFHGRVTLTTANHRADAHKFYENIGYECTGRRYIKKLTGGRQ